METIKNLLEVAGWYENRNIDISEMIQDYEKQGFKKPNNLVLRFLEEFGNLKIEFKTNDDLFCDVRVNPEVGLEFVDPDDLPMLETLVGDSLLPIGSINSDHGGFLLSFDGKFYLLGDNGIYYLGDQFIEVCETVFLQKSIRKIGGL